jgi:uncharacterized protein involved in cysteine biosynthesis
MLGAVFSVLGQMFTPPFRAVLLKSVALAIALLAVVVIVLFRLLEWLSGGGMSWLEVTIGPAAHGALAVVGWIVAIALGIGLFAGAVLLMPAVTALVASGEIAEQVERVHYPLDPLGVALPLPAPSEGVKTAALAVLVYVCCASFLCCLPGSASCYSSRHRVAVLREYFDLAAMRFHPPAESQALRRHHRGTALSPACSSPVSCRSRSSTYDAAGTAFWFTCTRCAPRISAPMRRAPFDEAARPAS